MKKDYSKTSNAEYNRARDKVNKKIGFFAHLTVYVCVNLFFHIINWAEGDAYWAFYPLLFWGLGLGIHYLNVFDVFEKTEWKRKRIEKMIEKQREKSRRQ
ncbi:MAG: 2TM domain-containing protein [Weeksellaceae bacterium]|nr:2TM domain-containing protein [Weeksellaceae bacterium]